MNYKKVYQKFILGTGNLDDALKSGLGGVIFFSKDIKTEEDFHSLICRIKKKSYIEPFLSIDQEGGRVERTENIYSKRLSPMFAYDRGKEFLEHQTEELASELNMFGINLNFAPCADVNTNPNNPIIGERAFSTCTEDVIEGVKVVSEIYRNHNIIACIKHFPGHGDASTDSHLDLPIIEMSKERMENLHIKPFKEAIDFGIDMIMVAHMFCKCFDEDEIPSSLSKHVIGYLRDVLNYKGVVISDDMVMKGIKYEPLEACIKGILAGLDLFIYRESNDMSLSLIEEVIKECEKSYTLQSLVEESDRKINSLKKKYNIIAE